MRDQIHQRNSNHWNTFEWESLILVFLCLLRTTVVLTVWNEETYNYVDKMVNKVIIMTIFIVIKIWFLKNIILTSVKWRFSLPRMFFYDPHIVKLFAEIVRVNTSSIIVKFVKLVLTVCVICNVLIHKFVFVQISGVETEYLYNIARQFGNFR